MAANLMFSFLYIPAPFSPARTESEIIRRVSKNCKTKFGRVIEARVPTMLPIIMIGSMILARS